MSVQKYWLSGGLCPRGLIVDNQRYQPSDCARRGIIFIRYTRSKLIRKPNYFRGPRGRERMVVGLTTICAISAYHHWSCEFEPRSWRGVLDTTLCDKVCQWLATGRWFSLGPLVSSINKIDRHNITEILLTVTLNTIKPNQTYTCTFLFLILISKYKLFLKFINTIICLLVQFDMWRTPDCILYIDLYTINLRKPSSDLLKVWQWRIRKFISTKTNH